MLFTLKIRKLRNRTEFGRSVVEHYFYLFKFAVGKIAKIVLGKVEEYL
jgi:hypothetical protein